MAESKFYSLVMHPRRPECLLKLRQAHDVDVDELYHFVSLCRTAGLVSHHLPHDPVERQTCRQKGEGYEII